MSDKTIYALSTVFGKSGVAVIRVSGADALNVIKEITKINVENMHIIRRFWIKIIVIYWIKL